MVFVLKGGQPPAAHWRLPPRFRPAQPPRSAVSIPTAPGRGHRDRYLDIGAELRREDIRIIDAAGQRHARPSALSDPRRDAIGRGIVLPLIQSGADSADEAGVEGGRRGPAAGDSARPARGLGARQRSDRRRRLRAARHARRRRRDREPDRTERRHDLEGDSDQRAGARGRHQDRARHRQATSRCRSAS